MPQPIDVAVRLHLSSHMLINKQSDFERLCDRIIDAGCVAFDTEFASEAYYRPRLCLLQFCVAGESYGVDPFLVQDLTRWWEIMADDQTTVIVHGGREEIRFCQFAIRERPRRLVDVQIAEGLRSRGFPLSHTNLVNRVLNHDLQHSKETRTDWERRPLTDKQIQYALEDVRFLMDVWARQREALTGQGRYDWAVAEFERLIDAVFAEDSRNSWERLPGIQKLNRRDLSTAQALSEWRDELAWELNKPPRRILRDDLLIDVAKRQPRSLKDLNLVRDMNRRDYQQYAEGMLAIVRKVAALPDDALASRQQHPNYPSQDEVLARILGLALANRCQELGISMSLVGTTTDLKDLVRWHVFDRQQGTPPLLLQGWRGEVCGRVLTNVLDGKVSLRVVDPHSENPLKFDSDT